MSDMTRHDIYGHEVKALEFYLTKMLEAKDKGTQANLLLEINHVLSKVKETDAGPLPRGERTAKDEVVAAIAAGLNAAFGAQQHVEVRILDKSTIQMFVRPKDGVVYDFVIKVQQPR